MSKEPLLYNQVPHEAIADISKKLSEDQTNTKSKSVAYNPDGPTASKLAQPGGFRRHYLGEKAKQQGISSGMFPNE